MRPLTDHRNSCRATVVASFVDNPDFCRELMAIHLRALARSREASYVRGTIKNFLIVQPAQNPPLWPLDAPLLSAGTYSRQLPSARIRSLSKSPLYAYSQRRLNRCHAFFSQGSFFPSHLRACARNGRKIHVPFRPTATSRIVRSEARRRSRPGDNE